MLKIRNLEAHYGRIQALRTVTMHVRAGEVVALIGANGAGKSTLLGAISGLIRPTGGQILLETEALERLDPAGIVRRGVIQVPEGRQLFGPLTVFENLELGAYVRWNKKNRRRISREIDRIFEMFPILAERRRQPAGTLSGGEQQMVALGRGLMGAPRLLLLDEPSLGLAPLIVAEIFRAIRKLKEEGTTILLVEQNARAALGAADRAYVLETGRVIMSGPAAQLAENQEVRRAFLGKEYRDKREI